MLTGKGEFPLREIVTDLEKLMYGGFISFEWKRNGIRNWQNRRSQSTICRVV